MPRLIVFDADGTLRRTTVNGQPCPHADGEWELLPGVCERLATLAADVLVGVASNQDHVGYGHVTAATARALLTAMIERATGRPIDVEAVRFCPHRLEVTCGCRKPEPGMLLEILRHYDVPAEDALFVGDSAVDAEAARRAGMPFEWARRFFA